MQERQDVDKLAAMAEDFKNGVQNGFANPTLEAPVHVVIKSPCVAVRYPLPPSSVSSAVLPNIFSHAVNN